MASKALPIEALDWLAVWSEVRGLVLADDMAVPRLLRGRGHSLFALTDKAHLAAKLSKEKGIHPLLARPEAIPTDPFQFEVVFVHQGLHHYNLDQALPQVARALRAGGCLSTSYLVRDDSVPWVRRLAALLRRYDPMAMKGNYGHASLEKIRQSPYFPEIEERAFRVWRTVSRDDLMAMVRSQPLARRLDEQQLGHLLGQVGELYDSSVRAPESLRLPFQLIAWRAWVNHSAMAAPLELPDSALRIPL